MAELSADRLAAVRSALPVLAHRRYAVSPAGDRILVGVQPRVNIPL
jgi:hypothetical protein